MKDKPTFEELRSIMLSDSYEGFCTECGEWTHDSCEPDARRYECPECGNFSCYGAEELLMRGYYDETSD